MAKTPKPEQTELPVEGPGVSAVKDKKLDGLARKFRDLREESAAIGEAKTANETAILERMKELGIRVYKIDDQLLTIKPAKRHVALKTNDNHTEAKAKARLHSREEAISSRASALRRELKQSGDSDSPFTRPARRIAYRRTILDPGITNRP